MFERAEAILKIVCAILAVFLVSQLARLFLHGNPLAGAAIPKVPTWSEPKPTNAPSENPNPVAASGPMGPGAGAVTSGPGAPAMPPGVMVAPMPARMARPSRRGPGGMPFPMGGPGQGPALPPETQKRVSRIVESGLLGPVIRPPPMALLGIAGEHVLLRAPNGQTGLIKTGQELGGIKLLRIGTNRVLVEENGQQKELSIFGGFGGASLVTEAKESTP